MLPLIPTGSPAPLPAVRPGPILADLLAALRNAECSGLGAAELLDLGELSIDQAAQLMRESLARVQEARREFERAVERVGRG